MGEQQQQPHMETMVLQNIPELNIKIPIDLRYHQLINLKKTFEFLNTFTIHIVKYFLFFFTLFLIKYSRDLGGEKFGKIIKTNFIDIRLNLRTCD